MIALIFCFYFIFNVGPFHSDEVRMVSSYTTWPLFIGTVLFAVEAVGVIIALEHNMEHPEHFLGCWGIFPWCIIVVITLYMAVGLLGYVKYGNDVKETIIASLPRDQWLSLVVEGVYALCIYGTYPLQCFVSLEILWGNYLRHYIDDLRKECCIEYTLRVTVVIITFVAAMIVPHIDIMISLVGAVCLSTLGIVFPFLMEMCTCWPGELGCCWYVFWKDLIFILIGIFILFIGAYVSLYTLFQK